MTPLQHLKAAVAAVLTPFERHAALPELTYYYGAVVSEGELALEAAWLGALAAPIDFTARL